MLRRWPHFIMVLLIFLTGCDLYRDQHMPRWQQNMATGYDPANDDQLARANPR